MNFERFLNNRHGWLDLEGPDSDCVIASSVAVSRNLVDAPFPARLSSDARRDTLDRMTDAARSIRSLPIDDEVDLSPLLKIEREFLRERRLITDEMLAAKGERRVLVGDRQQASLMLQEEDHLRLQVFRPGLALDFCWERANRIDDELAERLTFAYHEEWGFCTSDPANAGTALRGHCFLHMPALVMSGDAERVLETLEPLAISARPSVMGRSAPEFVDIFNARTFGQTESEVVRGVTEAARSLAEYERQAREVLLGADRRASTEDLVYRAWGILRHARSISYDEAMALLSRVRLGIEMGLDIPMGLSTLNNLMVYMQPAHLDLLRGGSFGPDERQHWRAELIRHRLKYPDQGPRPGDKKSH